MRVEVVIAHGPWSKGHIIPHMPNNAARSKIERGLVREILEDQTKAMQSPMDRMMRRKVMK